jgi:hypothetical protein
MEERERASRGSGAVRGLRTEEAGGCWLKRRAEMENSEIQSAAGRGGAPRWSRLAAAETWISVRREGGKSGSWQRARRRRLGWNDKRITVSGVGQK